MIVLRRHDELDLDTYWRIVDGHETVTVDSAALAHVADRRAAMEAFLATGAPAYGVTTGLGYFADRPIAGDERAGLQRAILVGRAAGVGPPEPEHVVRGTMLLRLNGFLAGLTGVTSDLCTFIADRLNARWYPMVPASRPGTAGETIPLCHLFQTLIGEGTVFVDDQPCPAAEALAAERVEPYALQLKEGLALINGAPHATALGADAARRGARLLDQATVIAALTAWSMATSWRPYSIRLFPADGDAGQRLIAARLAEMAAGSDDDVDADRPQAPVSLRVLPQVHGAAHDVVTQLHQQVERGLRTVTDSPLYLDATDGEPEGFYPSGHFHGQAMTLALDSAAIAMAQVAALSEKRLHRLLDARFSRLPDQLAADAARGGSGLVSLHKTVVGLAAENRMLASPASINTADTSAGQEDFQAFTGLAAGKLSALLDNLELALAAESIAVRQAAGLRHRANGARPLPPALAEIVGLLEGEIPFVARDRSLAPDLESAAALLRHGRLTTARTVPQAHRPAAAHDR